MSAELPLSPLSPLSPLVRCATDSDRPSSANDCAMGGSQSNPDELAAAAGAAAMAGAAKQQPAAGTARPGRAPSGVAPARDWENLAREWNRKYGDLNARSKEAELQSSRRLAAAVEEQERLRGVLWPAGAAGGALGLLVGAAAAAGVMTVLRKKAPGGIARAAVEGASIAAAEVKVKAAEAKAAASGLASFAKNAKLEKEMAERAAAEAAAALRPKLERLQADAELARRRAATDVDLAKKFGAQAFAKVT